MDSFAPMLQIILNIATLGMIVFAIIKMMAVSAEAIAERHRQRDAINAVVENVQKIELATNSMKDALVATTAVASRAEGLAEGKAAGALAIPDLAEAAAKRLKDAADLAALTLDHAAERAAKVLNDAALAAASKLIEGKS